MSGIETESIGHAWVVRISRPQRRNALDKAAWEGIGEAVRSVPDSARAIIVTGAEGVFSAGMDLKMDNPLLMEVGMAIGSADPDGLRRIIRSLKSCLAPLREARVPTIAAIEGACLGGGLEVALHCDVRVASDTAVFAMPEPRLGFVADVGGTTLLRRLVGPGRASWLITTARRLNADTARQWGLVEQRCGAGAALTAALSLVDDMAQGAPVATENSLGLLREDLSADFDAETEAGVRALLAGEVMEAVQARMERRPAAWCPPPPKAR